MSNPKSRSAAAANASANNAAATASNPLLTFFQSMLPTFNVQDLNRPADQEHQAHGEHNNQGNAGAGAGAGAGVFQMNNILERLREFLVDVEHQFPAAAVNNNNNDDANDDDVADHEEFD